MRFGYVFGLSLQKELMILSFFGILCTIFDTSLLELNRNWHKLWESKLDPHKFSDRVELYMKYTLSGIVLVRTFTVHIYLGCYILMLYPLIFEDRPALILPWLTISIIKSLITGFVSLLASSYTCFMYKFMKATCWEYLISHFLDDAPSVYMFCLVLTFYKDLKKLLKVSKYIDPIELKARRRRARLISDSKMALDYRDAFSRSLNGLMAKMKENEEDANVARQPIGKSVSIGPISSDAFSYRTTSSWQDRDTEMFSMIDASVSGRSFKQAANVLEVFAAHDAQQNEILEADAIDQMEELERVSDLEGNDIGRSEELRVDKDDYMTENYNTVSELLNDPNIAIVLNMIAGRDDPPWDSSEAAVVQSDSRFLPVPERDSVHSAATRTRTQEAGLQVTSPSFDMTIAELSQLPERESTSFGLHEPPSQKDDSSATQANKRKSTLTEPSIVKEAHSPLMPQMEGPRVSRRANFQHSSKTPHINQIYKNRASYPKTYRDDGYTQAFFENMHRTKEQQQKKQHLN